MPLVQTVVGQKQTHTLSSSRSKHQKTLKFRDVLFSSLVSMEKQSLLCRVMSSRLDSVLHVCFQLEISVLCTGSFEEPADTAVHLGNGV